MGNVLRLEIQAEELGLRVGGGLQAEAETLAAAEFEDAEGLIQLWRPLALQQCHKGQPLRAEFGIGPVSVSTIKKDQSRWPLGRPEGSVA